MTTIEVLRLLSDGRMSAHDTRAMMLSMGHSAEEFAQAFTDLVCEESNSLRVSKAQMGEMQADLFLTVRA